jgi:hypothetical protein
MKTIIQIQVASINIINIHIFSNIYQIFFLHFLSVMLPALWCQKYFIIYDYQKGAHSYTYDVDHSFSHAQEVYCYSALVEDFQNSLKNKPYRQILSKDYFDLDYIDVLVDEYYFVGFKSRPRPQSSGILLKNLVIHYSKMVNLYLVDNNLPLFAKSAKYENEKKYVKNIIQLTEAQLTEKSTVPYNLMLTDHLHRGSEAKRCIKEVGLDDLLSFFYIMAKSSKRKSTTSSVGTWRLILSR